MLTDTTEKKQQNKGKNDSSNKRKQQKTKKAPNHSDVQIINLQFSKKENFSEKSSTSYENLSNQIPDLEILNKQIKKERNYENYKRNLNPVKSSHKSYHQVEKVKADFFLNWKQKQSFSKKNNVLVPPESTLKFEVDSIIEQNLSEYGKNLQALFLNIKWKTLNNPEGLTMEELIEKSVMDNGIVFVWSEKEYLSQIIQHFESNNFKYVENFAIIFMDKQQILNFDIAKNQNNLANQQNKKNFKITEFFKRVQKQPEISQQNQEIQKKEPIQDEKYLHQHLQQLEAEQVLLKENSTYFNKAKKVLLLFRKFNDKEKLELRHQRTSDVMFELVNNNSNEIYDNETLMNYVYQMIETLLPKAGYEENANDCLRMMELWAPSNRPRKGWIQLIEKQKE